MVPPGHLLRLTMLEQAAPHKGAQHLLAHPRLDLAHRGRIEPGRMARRSTPAQLVPYLDKIRRTLDDDGNNNSDALPDGCCCSATCSACAEER